MFIVSSFKRVLKIDLLRRKIPAMTHRRIILRNVVAGVLASAAMVTAAGPAFAGDPIPDIDVKVPRGSVSVSSTGVSVTGFGPSINILFQMMGGGGVGGS